MQVAKKRQSSTYYIFTHNNPKHALDVVFQELHDEGILEYATWQLEIGESGTLHHQGFVKLYAPQRLSFMRAIEDTAHWEMAYKPKSAQGYCCKEDTRVDGPYTIGTWVPPHSGQGQRTDLTPLRDALIDNRDDRYLIDNHFQEYLQYQRGIMAARAVLSPRRTWTTELFVLLGKPGTGKTTYCCDTAPNLPNFTGIWFKPTHDWWDGYAGESDIVLDDFYGWLPFHFLLRLCDFPPLLLNIKGGSAQCLARRVWITSNKLPNAWWKEAATKYDFTALERRMTLVMVFETIQTIHTYNSYDELRLDTAVINLL